MKGVVFTIVLVLCSVFFCVGTVKCTSQVPESEMEVFYREKEAELVEEAREFLTGEGFVNSGIMLTRVVCADGSREYTLTVHHGGIDAMSGEEREVLMGNLEKIMFVEENCRFFHEFLINE